MRVEFSLRAERDLEELYRYGIEKFGIAVAESYAEGITQAVYLIAQQPHIARLRNELSPPVPGSRTSLAQPLYCLC